MSGIPFLVDLPILVQTVRILAQSERIGVISLILITPHIIDDLIAPSGQLSAAGRPTCWESKMICGWSLR